MKLMVFLAYIFISVTQILSQEKIIIAVIELESNGLSKSDTQVFTDRLRTELFKTDQYIVLERDKMNEILAEQGFQLSGCTSAECAVEAGKLLGVQQMVAGNVGVIGSLITINIRLIDIESGKVVNAITKDCECPIETALTRAVRQAAEQLAGKRIDDRDSLYPIHHDGVYFCKFKSIYIYLKLYKDGRAFRQYSDYPDFIPQKVFVTEYDSVAMKGNYTINGTFIEINVQARLLNIWSRDHSSQYIYKKENYQGRIINNKLVLTYRHSDYDQTSQRSFEFYPISSE